MKHLGLLRHAKSSWDDPGLSDRDRPLARRGERAATRIAEHLAESAERYELVLCSPARRTRQTLERIRPSLGNAEVRFDEALYGASSDRLLALLRDVPESSASVLLLAHNPGLQDLALELAERGDDLDRLRAKLPTGGLVRLTFDGTWRDLRPNAARLTAFVTPRDLG